MRLALHALVALFVGSVGAVFHTVAFLVDGVTLGHVATQSLCGLAHGHLEHVTFDGASQHTFVVSCVALVHAAVHEVDDTRSDCGSLSVRRSSTVETES